MSRPGNTLRRAAVTGATGFCGTALVHALAAKGIEVLATDRYEPLRPLPASRFLRADIRDRGALAGLFSGADTVFHLAAIASIARAPEHAYAAVNVGGTRSVLGAARAAGVARLVHISSSTVYGVPESCPVTEDAPLRPHCAYSRSKREAEEVIAAAGSSGLDATVIRPRVVVGPGRAGIFALFFAFLDHDLPIPLPGGGRNLFQFTAVDDLCRACLRVAAEPAEPGRLRVYNVGSEVRRPLRAELDDLIGYTGSRSRILPLPSRPAVGALGFLHRFGLSPLVPEQYRIVDADFVLDTSRIRHDLGFVPRHENGDGLRAAWRWWREHADRKGPATLLRWLRPRHQNLLQRRGPAGRDADHRGRAG